VKEGSIENNRAKTWTRVKKQRMLLMLMIAEE
jgi:hypothetical protein